MSGLVYEPLYAPNVPQVPASFSVAEPRSTSAVDGSTPDPASEPFPVVNETEAVVYHGPPVSEIVWPVGEAVSGVTVYAAVFVAPAPFVTVTVLAPLAVSLAAQE